MTSDVLIRCPACEQTGSIAAVQVSGERVVLTCSGCGAEHGLGTGGNAADAVMDSEAGESPPANVEPNTLACPKCTGAVGVDLAACPQCGLLVSGFDAYGESEEEQAPATVLALWAQCDENFSEPATHEAFRDAVAAAGAYGYAARRYRVAQRTPDRAEIAEQRLIRIRRMAEAALLTRPPGAAPSSPGASSRGVVLVFVAVMVLVAAILGVYFLMRGIEAERNQVKKPVTPNTNPAPARRGGAWR